MMHDDIPPPARLKKGVPPPLDATNDNLATPHGSSSRVALTFMVPNEFRKGLKIQAASAGITLQQLMEQAIQLWQERYG